MAPALTLFALLVACAVYAAPSSHAARATKLSLSRHVLTDGAKPRDTARLALSPKSEDLQNYYKGTDLQGNISNDNEPYKGASCSSCVNQKKFNSAASSTFYDYQQTSTETFGTGVGVDPSDYESLTLSAVRDTVAIAGLSATNTNFYLITEQSSGFNADPFDGIFGMGYDGDGTVFQNLVNQGLP
ncbi:hypothetical protein FRC10_003143, partial [Ceratobasidium sp. 414]